jgi:hypothetical protein
MAPHIRSPSPLDLRDEHIIEIAVFEPRPMAVKIGEEHADVASVVVLARSVTLVLVILFGLRSVPVTTTISFSPSQIVILSITILRPILGIRSLSRRVFTL